MPAELESMFYVSNEKNARFVPWHGMGTPVEEALTSKDAIDMAGLNWKVESKPIFDVNGKEIHGYKANMRDADGAVFGIVSNRYKIVQNSDAFDFTDALVGDGITYETAGSLKGGKTIWLLGKMPERYIVGDKFEPYICFSNSHDGMGAVRVAMTPIRVVCNNTLNLAMHNASRTWSTRHIGDINAKLEEARHTLQMANEYLDNLAIKADILANEKMTDGQIEQSVDALFPIDDDMSKRKKTTMQDAKDSLMICMLRPDIAQFLNTKWGFINAVSDYIGHSEPARMTDSYYENNWGKIMGGHPLLDKAMSVINA